MEEKTPIFTPIDPEDVDSFISRKRIHTLQNKFGINKKFIEKQDLEKLVEKMNLTTTIGKEDVSKIFNQIDITNSGKVSVSIFFDSIHNQMDYLEVFKKINEQLTTKSERIIIKLKKLKSRAIFSSDNESLNDLDWIISSFSEDMFEPELEKIINKGKELKMDNELGWLKQASKAHQFCKNNDDIVQISNSKLNSIKRNKTTFYSSLRSSLSGSVSDAEEFNRAISIHIENRKISSLSELPSSVIESVKSSLEQINTFTFDIFELNNLLDRRTLHFMAYEVFNKYNFFEELIDEGKYKNFIKEVIAGYDRSVIYHNDLHSGDVFQTVYVMIECGDLIKKLNLNDIDVLACLLAGICHDFKHNGYNNMFHINDKTPIAITYNDSSVLENFHVAESFKLLMKEENNLLCNLKPEEWRLVRRRIIDCILSTDMANHAKHINTLKTKLETYDIKGGKNIENMMGLNGNVAKTYENQQLILGMCVHSADVSNPAKPEHINKIWVERVFVEFFNQGDEEKAKGLPVSILCDRVTTNVNKSQIGFINFVVAPTFETLMNIIPEIYPYYEIIMANLKRYEALVQDENGGTIANAITNANANANTNANTTVISIKN